MNLEEIVRIAGGSADREHRDRRERIATAAFHGLLSMPFGSDTTDDQIAAIAVRLADALIRELDKKEGGT